MNKYDHVVFAQLLFLRLMHAISRSGLNSTPASSETVRSGVKSNRIQFNCYYLISLHHDILESDQPQQQSEVFERAEDEVRCTVYTVTLRVLMQTPPKEALQQGKVSIRHVVV